MTDRTVVELAIKDMYPVIKKAGLGRKLSIEEMKVRSRRIVGGSRGAELQKSLEKFALRRAEVIEPLPAGDAVKVSTTKVEKTPRKRVWRADKQLTILGVDPIAMWGFGFHEETCPICLDSLISICGDCEDAGDTSACCVNVGECRHAVHGHCLQKWVHKDICVVCRQPWKLEKTVPIV